MVSKIVSIAGRPNGLSYSWMINIGESLQIEELIGEGYYNIVIKVCTTLGSNHSVVAGLTGPWTAPGNVE